MRAERALKAAQPPGAVDPIRQLQHGREEKEVSGGDA